MFTELEAGTLLQLIVTLSAVVWIVGEIKATTRELGEKIAGLRESIDHLRSWLDRHTDTLGEHERRLSVVEGTVSNHVEAHR